LNWVMEFFHSNIDRGKIMWPRKSPSEDMIKKGIDKAASIAAQIIVRGDFPDNYPQVGHSATTSSPRPTLDDVFRRAHSTTTTTEVARLTRTAKGAVARVNYDVDSSSDDDESVELEEIVPKKVTKGTNKRPREERRKNPRVKQ
jgi:hypothetical protein